METGIGQYFLKHIPVEVLELICEHCNPGIFIVLILISKDMAKRIIKYIRSLKPNPYPSLSLYSYGAKFGSIDTIKLAIKIDGGNVCSQKIMQLYLSGNNINKCAPDISSSIRKDVSIVAAKNGHLFILKWLLCELQYIYRDVHLLATEHGHLEIIKWSVEYNRPNCCPSHINKFMAKLCKIAALHGRVEILQWIHTLTYRYYDKETKYRINLDDIADKAVNAVQLNVLQWIAKNNNKPFGKSIYHVAVTNKLMCVLVWMKEHYTAK
jgi:hypothetical protein